MQRRAFGTALGEVWLWGNPDAFDGAGPLVLVVLGTFAQTQAHWERLSLQLPGAALLYAPLPGHFSPALSDTSVRGFAAAFDHVIRTAFAGRPVVVCGESVGGLVVLAMEAGPRLALDPPLRTEKMWPLASFYRSTYEEGPAHREFLANLLGVTADGQEVRDYTALLDRPATVLIGGIPLMPPRRLGKQPGYVDAPEREVLRKSPDIRLTVVEGAGHKIVSEAADVVAAALRDLLEIAGGQSDT